MRFRGSQFYSIDAFLEKNPDCVALGKLLIADCLKSHEDEDRLFPPHDPGWYQYLFNSLADTVDAVGESHIAIVTFNYDRSLEAYLHRSIQHRFRVSEEGAADLLGQVRIIHPHGILGPYPEVPYQTTLDEIALADIAKGIKIINEFGDTGDGFCSPEFEEAHALLEKAHRIYFLGFGFHEDNLRRFRYKFFGKPREPYAIGGTIPRMGDAVQRRLRSRLDSYGLAPDDNLRAQGLVPYDCNSFFDYWGSLD